MSMLERVLARIREVPELADNIVAWRTVPGRPARLAPFPEDLDPGLVAVLRQRGVEQLYAHQRLAIDAIRAGRHTVVVTPTASGKTLCYNLPVLERLRARPGARALYLFPTKALSQDQVRELTGLVEGLQSSLRAYTYDGDTPPAMRSTLRRSGDIVVTNPHMLHQGILPNHMKWVDLFANLDFVVIDELHHYRGVFGSHVAAVLRRLRRICRHYGRTPTFVATSATIANPRELAETLVGEPFQLVGREEDGSPHGPRHFIFYNPPLVHREMGLRVPALEEVRRFAPLFLRAGVQVIYFLRTRAQVEILTKYLRDVATQEAVEHSRVRGYRGGYLPLLRREIEAGLKSGEILAVAATNALELGVDIGSLEAAVLVGYPGSVASLWQQAGRAGRRQGESVVLLCARANPLDQYLMRNPEFLFEAPVEAVRVDPDNLVIRLSHLKCSIFELPMPREEEFGGPGDRVGGKPEDGNTLELLEYLSRDAGLLTLSRTPRGERYHWMSEAYPAQHISLNAADVDNFVVYDVEERRIFAELDRPAALTEIHQGAIYGHQGEQYYIEELDYENRRALARRQQVDYYTQAETDVALEVVFEDQAQNHRTSSTEVVLYRCGLGQVHVTVTATIYKKLKFYTRENVGAGEIDLPPEVMDTDSMWLVLSEWAAQQVALREGSNPRGLASLGHMLRNLLPLYLRCDAGDLRCHTEIQSPHFHRPVIFLYEAAPGGVGLARRGFECHRAVLGSALEVLQGCRCLDGCPGCTGVPAPTAGRADADPGKRVALDLCRLLLSADASCSPGTEELP